MIRRKTVFVVGAGASSEVGLPTGPGLSVQIASRLDFEVDRQGGHLASGDEQVYHCLHAFLAARRATHPAMADMFRHAKRLRNGMRQGLSIDTFLDTHQDEPDLVFCGKAAIARVILDAEGSSSMYADATSQSVDWDRLGQTWYPQLWKTLSQGVSKSDIDKIFKNVSFVVFNYDRCVELFLLASLQNHFNLDLAHARSLVNSVPILHPYGSLGPMVWQHTTDPTLSIGFGEQRLGSQLVHTAGQIRTFSEQVTEITTLASIQQLMAGAERVVILGFAYHDQNMPLLFDPVQKQVTAEVYGTTQGLPGRDIGHIKSAIVQSFRPQAGAGFEALNVSCSQLFFELGKTLAR